MARLFLPAAALVLAAAAAPAQDWSALREPGTIALMRHAEAPGTGDPAGFALGDCSTQRNLDGGGRAQAEAIGASLREAGIEFGAVLSSQWCRCLDTAALLGLGPVEAAPALNSFFQDRAKGPPQTTALRLLIAQRPGRLMLVTHQVNITALSGVFPRSGEVVILQRTAGRLELLDRVLIAP